MAIEPVEATGPADPAIPFAPISHRRGTGDRLLAARRRRPERRRGTSRDLYRIRDGAAVPIAYDRLEPSQPDVLRRAVGARAD